MANTHHIVFLDRDTLGPGVALKRPDFDHSWTDFPSTRPDQVVARADASTMVVINKVPLSERTLGQLSRLQLVAVAATGTDVVDLEACRRRGVAVCNVRNYAATSVPEHILALMLSLRRRLPAYQRRVRQGDWQGSGQFCFFDHPVTDLAGSTLGIVGTGSIADALGKLAQALGMAVIFHSVSGRAPAGRTMVDLDGLLQASDVVSLNCPLTEASASMIDERALRMMKPEALLINTARGALVDSEALEKAIISGAIGGAGIDVATTEPPARDDPLMRLCHLDNVLVTPHSAWASVASMQALADQLIASMEAFAAGQEMNRVV